MSDPSQSELNQTISNRFCTRIDGDVTFQSVDQVLFYIQPKYLEATTGGFPPVGFQTLDETVSLTENSGTLEILFQFVYPARHPDLETLEFGDLAMLAEAAEKYQVYTAMGVCKICMKQTLPSHAEDIVKYAVKHGYIDIISKAAPWMVRNKQLGEVIALMPSHLVLPWVLYHTNLVNAVESSSARNDYSSIQYFFNSQSTKRKTCTCSKDWTAIEATVLSRILQYGTIKSLLVLNFVFSKDTGCCENGRLGIAAWRAKVEAAVAGVPDFSTFL